jgi:hypothetical protein
MVAKDNATIKAKIEVESKLQCNDCQIVSQIISLDGKSVVLEKSDDFKNDKSLYELFFKNIKNPKLWSSSSPNNMVLELS